MFSASILCYILVTILLKHDRKVYIANVSPVLYTQVRELNTECIRLTTSYPGPSATAVANSMEEVQLAWESLQVSSSGRKKKLRAALELQKLLTSVSNTI